MNTEFYALDKKTNRIHMFKRFNRRERAVYDMGMVRLSEDEASDIAYEMYGVGLEYLSIDWTEKKPDGETPTRCKPAGEEMTKTVRARARAAGEAFVNRICRMWSNDVLNHEAYMPPNFLKCSLRVKSYNGDTTWSFMWHFGHEFEEPTAVIWTISNPEERVAVISHLIEATSRAMSAKKEKKRAIRN